MHASCSLGELHALTVHRQTGACPRGRWAAAFGTVRSEVHASLDAPPPHDTDRLEWRLERRVINVRDTGVPLAPEASNYWLQGRCQPGPLTLPCDSICLISGPSLSDCRCHCPRSLPTQVITVAEEAKNHFETGRCSDSDGFSRLEVYYKQFV